MNVAIFIAPQQSVLKITLRTVAIQMWLLQHGGAAKLSLCVTALVVTYG
jgi:hypothetical protein